MNDRLPIWKLVSVAKEELLLLGHVAFGWWEDASCSFAGCGEFCTT